MIRSKNNNDMEQYLDDDQSESSLISVDPISGNAAIVPSSPVLNESTDAPIRMSTQKISSKPIQIVPLHPATSTGINVWTSNSDSSLSFGDSLNSSSLPPTAIGEENEVIFNSSNGFNIPHAQYEPQPFFPSENKSNSIRNSFQNDKSIENKQLSATTLMFEALSAAATSQKFPLKNQESVTSSMNIRLKTRVHLMVVIRVLLQYLTRVDEAEGSDLAQQAKQTIADCHLRHRSGDPKFRNLSESLQRELRQSVGEFHWIRAEQIHRHAQFRCQRKQNWSSTSSGIHSQKQSGDLILPGPSYSSNHSIDITQENSSGDRNLSSPRLNPQSNFHSSSSNIDSRSHDDIQPVSICSNEGPPLTKGISMHQQKRYNTASGLPPSYGFRDAQLFKKNASHLYWAPDIEELNFLTPHMKVQCTVVSTSQDGHLIARSTEQVWIVLAKILRKKSASQPQQIMKVLVGHTIEDLENCHLPTGSLLMFLPKHIQRVDSNSANILFEKNQIRQMQKQERRMLMNSNN